MRFKEDIDIVRKRMDAFWANELMDRALVSMEVPKQKGINNSLFDQKKYGNDKNYLEKFWFDPQTIHDANIRRMENTYYAGDAIPAIFLNFGTSGHCHFFGSVPTLSSETLWFDPVWESLEDCDNSFRPDIMRKHVKIASDLADLSKGDYFVGMPDSCGTLDAIGHLYGSDNVLMDMISDPDELKHAIKIVNKGWKESTELFYNALKEVNNGSCHSWMHLLAPGKMAQMQCDMSVMFSRDMFQEFVYDELKEQIDFLDYPIYHFDGIEQERHLDILLSFEKLKVIQWTHVAGQPKASTYLSTLKRIQDAGKRLIIGVMADEIPIILENMSAKGMSFKVRGIKNPEEADSVVKLVETYSKE
ncbi:MAG: trimethylamine corrinoid protein 2 [Candidatus Epulonipiscioides saccharophilum]|nr:MAG: trimethylamine corrinoid protein 2 [Epulopiscium sp. AS2M-Bin001]